VSDTFGVYDTSRVHTEFLIATIGEGDSPATYMGLGGHVVITHLDVVLRTAVGTTHAVDAQAVNASDAHYSFFHAEVTTDGIDGSGYTQWRGEVEIAGDWAIQVHVGLVDTDQADVFVSGYYLVQSPAFP
jgi:hypothetical protein